MTCTSARAALALVLAGLSWAPSGENDGRFDAYRERLEQLSASGLSEGRAWPLLAELVKVAPHRLSGSDGAARAVEWARATMEELGFDAVRLEPCRVPHWERGEPEELVFVEPKELAGQRLPVLALGGSVGTAVEGVEGELVVVESFRELAELGDGAKEKLVLFNQPMQDALSDPFAAYGGAVFQRSQGGVQASKAGAVGALVRSMTQARDDFPHTGAMSYEDGVEPVPAAAVSTLAADRLAALASAGEPVRLRLKMSCRTLEDADSANVVGELRGSELPEELVLIGAHLDAWDVGQGAHDDGSGCAQVLEAVRLLRANGIAPRRTIRVVLFMNEENGLAGARAYRAAHLEELDHHVLALEADRGGFTPRGFATNAAGELRSILGEVAALLAPLGAGTVQGGHGGADISPLAQDGVPLVGYVPDAQRYFDYHHSARDRIEAVHPRELELGAIAIASLAYLIADFPDALPRPAGTR